jgi:GH24 family phage-related lysozyme (muramidase)
VLVNKGKSGIALGALLMVAAPLIVHYEGNVTHTYADVNGVATVCAGETGHDVTWGMQFTMQQCLARLEPFCADLSRWTYSQGRQLKGLVKRRAAERALCETP